MWQYTDMIYSWPNLEPVCFPCPVLTVASWPAYTFLSWQVRWSGISISLRVFHSLLWSTQSKALVNIAETDVLVNIAHVLLELSCFFYDSVDVGNLISCSSAFQNPAWTSGNSQLAYCWSLAWRILSVTLLVCEMSAVVQ